MNEKRKEALAAFYHAQKTRNKGNLLYARAINLYGKEKIGARNI